MESRDHTGLGTRITPKGKGTTSPYGYPFTCGEGFEGMVPKGDDFGLPTPGQGWEEVVFAAILNPHTGNVFTGPSPLRIRWKDILRRAAPNDIQCGAMIKWDPRAFGEIAEPLACSADKASTLTSLFLPCGLSNEEMLAIT